MLMRRSPIFYHYGVWASFFAFKSEGDELRAKNVLYCMISNYTYNVIIRL